MRGKVPPALDAGVRFACAHRHESLLREVGANNDYDHIIIGSVIGIIIVIGITLIGIII